MIVSADNLSVEFGGEPLFSGISFMINRKERVGLVGKNGAGKTTILRLIAGENEPTRGGITTSEGVTVGYLPQEMNVHDHRDVWKETESAFDELLNIQARIEHLSDEIAHREDYQSEEYHKLLDELAHQTERVQMLDGNLLEGRIEKMLLGLGFEKRDFARQTSEFSGGWRMRIELAKILLRQPDMLLLDEPTNHLDIESIIWLEGFLNNFDGAALIISHDKRFLDTVTNRTMEIALGHLYDYPVNYSSFLQLRVERIEQQKAAYDNQQKEIKRSEEFIQRFRYQATKAVQVQQRIRQLEKMDRINVDPEDRAAMKIRFPKPPRSGQVVVQAKGVSKQFGDNKVLENIDLTVTRNQRIAFVGRNGEGKTTMARMIVGELDYQGDLQLGHQVELGYFAQNQEDLMDAERTVFQTLDDKAVGDVRTKVRDILGAFLFSGEDIDKKVKVLSGGERSRLAMARMLLNPYNLLILDEPTNHLDMRSKEILKQALNEYEGTLIVVSHDREFLEDLVEQVYEFNDKGIKEYPGDINDFLEKKQLGSMWDFEQTKGATGAAQSVVQKHPVQSNKERFEQRKQLDKKIRKVQRDIQQIEKKIEQLENESERLAGEMNESRQDNQQSVSEQYQNIKIELDKQLERWEACNAKLERFTEDREKLN